MKGSPSGRRDLAPPGNFDLQEEMGCMRWWGRRVIGVTRKSSGPCKPPPFSLERLTFGCTRKDLHANLTNKWNIYLQGIKVPHGDSLRCKVSCLQEGGSNRFVTCQCNGFRVPQSTCPTGNNRQERTTDMLWHGVAARHSPLDRRVQDWPRAGQTVFYTRPSTHIS